MNAEELLPVVTRLTESGKLQWHSVGSAYRARIGDATIAITGGVQPRFSIYNSAGTEIDSSIAPILSLSSSEGRLFEFLRRKSLNIDETLSKLAQDLKRLDALGE